MLSTKVLSTNAPNRTNPLNRTLAHNPYLGDNPMFQATRRRLALWYTAVTAVLLLLFASGFYLYVRNTLVERVDDTLNHVVEVVHRSLVIEAADPSTHLPPHLNLEASFGNNADTVDDDHIDLEWFSPTGELLWSTLSQPLNIPLHVSDGETVYAGVRESGENLTEASSLAPSAFALRQITQRIEMGRQVVGYLRVSHPWFEVTKPSRQLIRDLSLGTSIMIGAIAAIGWFLSGLAMAPVRDSYQQLKQFTADASHELRNPIAVLQTNVQVALADPDPELQEQQLRVVERLTRRLSRLVDDLLFLARQDSGMIPLHKGTLQMDKLLQEVAEEQRVIAQEKEITLATHIDIPSEGSYTMRGDRDQLTRLLTNLVSNAIYYTPEGGQVYLSLKTQSNQLFHITVKDTGIGISEEALPHIFDRFYRVDPARSHRNRDRTSSQAGSGLGLAIAKVIVENHQGDIHVESTPGQGTTFAVNLPRHWSDS